MKKQILTIIISVILTFSLTANYYHKQIKQSYWEGVQNQFNEERYLDNKESAKQDINLPLQKMSKDEILKELANIESLGGKKRKVMDLNGKYSLGLFHFQASTIKDMYKRFYKKDITIQEAIKIAEDDKLSTKLAHDAIFIYNEKNHWKLSMCRLANRGIIEYKCPENIKNSKFTLK